MAITSGKLTIHTIRRLNLFIITTTAFALLLVLGSVFWMTLRIGGEGETQYFGRIAFVACSLLGAYLACGTAYLARKGPVILSSRYQLAWLCIGLGLLSVGLGGLCRIYLAIIHVNLFPLYTSVGFTLLYIFTLTGLLLMPSALRFRPRMGLDALITTLCFSALSWFFVLGPAYFAYVKHTLAIPELSTLLMGLSYPCWDLLLVFAIALIVQRRVERILYPSFLVLTLGVTAIICADTGYNRAIMLLHIPQPMIPWISLCWLSGYILLGLAGAFQYMTFVKRSYREQNGQPEVAQATSALRYEIEVANGTWRGLQNLFLYIPLTILLVVTLLGELIYDDERAKYLVVLTTFIGILVAVRYLSATHENEKLLQERERERTDVEHLRQLSVRLTSTISIEPLWENIVHLVTRELGFDVALLLLREKEYEVVSPQSYILVKTSSTMTPATSWRLRGDSFFATLLTMGKGVVIDWNTCPYGVPMEIVAWRQQQRLSNMYFFQLIYQEEVLGCLGVARKMVPTLEPYDVLLVQKYVEQVASIVKQAYLYKETSQQKAFAHAMVNIAARLNSALVAPAEIQQLLCIEGASALHADYVLLYVPGNNGRLVPQALYNVLTDIQQPFTDWPAILPHEAEAQAFYGLQPMLVPVYRPKTLQTDTVLVPQVQHHNEGSLLHQKLLSYRSETVILAPLISGGEPIGMLIFGRCVPEGSRERQALGRESLPMAQDFAEQASVAFTNAYLYQDLSLAHDKMQALDQLKDQFMVTASHELRTPLTAVQGYIELLSQYEKLLTVEQRRDFLLKARRSCEELVVMLGNVMDASRLEVEAGIHPTQLERVDVNEAFDSVITIIEPQAQHEKRQLVRDIPSSLFVLADPARLRQVLMNISVNALKYSPSHTPIRFTAAIDPDHEEAVILSITDKGNGITPQEQAKLFQRFVRLERDVNSPVRGSGLGLYISRRLVQAMGGSIWIESSGIAGEGTTLHIRLPLA